jgi:hypothetical protein
MSVIVSLLLTVGGSVRSRAALQIEVLALRACEQRKMRGRGPQNQAGTAVGLAPLDGSATRAAK